MNFFFMEEFEEKINLIFWAWMHFNCEESKALFYFLEKEERIGEENKVAIFVNSTIVVQSLFELGFLEGGCE